MGSPPGGSVDEYRGGVLDALLQRLNHGGGVMPRPQSGDRTRMTGSSSAGSRLRRRTPSGRSTARFDADDRDLGRVMMGVEADSAQLPQARPP